MGKSAPARLIRATPKQDRGRLRKELEPTDQVLAI